AKNKGKRKVLTQKHVCSRMNFLYQASQLMAHSQQNTLAAYYGKLCRNVGTKALMHIAPDLKRTLCKRCSLPLLPGVNTTLQLQTEPKKQPEEPPTTTDAKPKRKRRCRRLPKHKQNKSGKTSQSVQDEHAKLQLECCLCHAQRHFQVNTERECWSERAEAIAQVVSLQEQDNA
ncbi:CG33082, partial [Drosophila busckii]